MFRGKGGQAEARELAVELYREHRDYLLRIALSNTKSMTVAEEALQEAFISFLRHFDPGRGAPPIAWLTLTLKRECRRRQGREKWDRRAGQERERGEDVPGFVLESIPSRATGPEERIAERDHAQRRLAHLKPDERTGLGLLAALASPIGTLRRGAAGPTRRRTAASPRVACAFEVGRKAKVSRGGWRCCN